MIPLFDENLNACWRKIDFCKLSRDRQRIIICVCVDRHTLTRAHIHILYFTTTENFKRYCRNTQIARYKIEYALMLLFTDINENIYANRGHTCLINAEQKSLILTRLIQKFSVPFPVKITRFFGFFRTCFTTSIYISTFNITRYLAIRLDVHVRLI